MYKTRTVFVKNEKIMYFCLFQVKLAKTKEELISQLYGPSPSSDKFSHSNESLRKCVEMKDEGIQAKLDDVFDPNENGPEQKEEFITDSVDTDDN